MTPKERMMRALNLEKPDRLLRVDEVEETGEEEDEE